MITSKADTGVSNPYALAEVISGRRIHWQSVADKKSLLENIFGLPYDEIIHPGSGSPIFYTFEKEWKLDLKELPRDIKFDIEKFDKFDLANHLDQIKSIEDLQQIITQYNLPKTLINKIEILDDKTLRIEIPSPSRQVFNKRDRKYTNKAITKKFFQESLYRTDDSDRDWEPPGGSWSGTSAFFNEAAEFHDPIQGIVGDCYLIAALSSVAWARPFDIYHKTRAIGKDQSEFVNMVKFYDENGVSSEVEVTSSFPVSDYSGGPIFARSLEANESWPAIIEKAYAKWRTNHTGDKPDIMQLAGGSPSVAIHQLTGLKEWHDPTSDYSADDLWDLVRSNSKSRRTILPMTASTASELMINELGGTYLGSGIGPGHAYSILGWDFHNDEKYIILRNPWGYQEPDTGVLSTSVSFFDISWWRSIDLLSLDGVFGLKMDVFKEYFYYIGGGSEL